MLKNYNKIEKILHKLSLGTEEMKKIFFFLEKNFFGKKIDFNNQTNNIFLGGLPRCGSTALLYLLNESNEFGVLKYKNMPFILSPKINQIIFNKFNKSISKERVHEDGLKFSLDTPEAFDEIFFSIFPNETFEELKKNYSFYINQILDMQNKNRYLSKNNNLFNRIDFLNDCFENSAKLFLIRHPFYHSYSLYRQHQKFCKLQKQDIFVKKYMDYLYHKEFGLNHEPWNKPIDHILNNNLNYWLEQWYLYYKSLFLKIENGNYKNLFYLVYEDFENSNFVENLKNNLKLRDLSYKFLITKNKNLSSEIDISNENLKNKCIVLYQKFISAKENISNCS